MNEIIAFGSVIQSHPFALALNFTSVLKQIYFKKHMYCCTVFDGDGVSRWMDDNGLDSYLL